ncbi:galactonate dehydratase [Candidatus Poribacteria bacterium]|jgi:galactonate dehydratase|nr:galactonate dehydratase [Candidatus Poribacteria bacterium]MBT5537220.1 galactonate dehydratase [Candidatus Poribacteria bacterium]MBT7096227.1 galactonate dehydratase [Candidatus Poribacteria bacterium]MBT7808957.1 galactonate dehydratase [Candidatus Poribacteria bacterium]
MKITDLKVYRMAAPTGGSTNWTFVRIETDEGIHGIGEASLQYKDDALEAELLDFRKYLIGKDPFRIDHIWTSLYRRVTWSGGAVTISAISAIDLALWDIKGKALGVPVYELVGGESHDRIRIYANGWFEGADGPESYAEKAAAAVADGYTAIKLYPFSGTQGAGQDRLSRGTAVVAAVREAVGPDIEIAIDIRARMNMWSARRVAQRLEPYDIAWLEEPVMFDNVDSIAQLAREVSVPVATGEQLYTRWEFRALLEQNAVGIIQPDICHAGGMSELRKIAAMAETYYVMVVPHNSNGPISTVASLHLDMSIPNSYLQEVFVNWLPVYDEVLTNPLVIEDGQCRPPDGPGWGTDIDEDALAQYPPAAYTPVASEPYLQF